MFYVSETVLNVCSYPSPLEVSRLTANLKTENCSEHELQFKDKDLAKMIFLPLLIFKVTDSSDFFLNEQSLATRTKNLNECGLQFCAWEIPSTLQYYARKLSINEH